MADDPFTKAAEAHKAWYRANGFRDNDIAGMRLIARDSPTGAMSYSESEVLSFHLRPPDPVKVTNSGNTAWPAYVKQYQDVSTIKTEHMICMPKGTP